MLQLLRDERARHVVDQAVLASALKDALEARGHVRLVDAASSGDSQQNFGLLIALVLFWGLGASIGAALNLSPALWVVIALAGAIAYGILASRLPDAGPPVAIAIVAAWLLAAVAFAFADPSELVWTHGVPLLAATLVAIGLRRLHLREARDVTFALAGLARSTPYVVPVVLVVVLLPALTADVWELAGTAGATNLVAAGLLSVGTLLLLVSRQLRREFGPALASRAQALAADPVTPDRTRNQLAGEVDDQTAKAIRELPAEILSDTWPATADEYAPYLATAEGDVLRKPLGMRLGITTVGVGVMLSLYIYALLAATVPSDLAAEWSQTSVPVHEVALLGLSVDLPGGPYVAIAVLLGIFATAIFLAFAVTEEAVATALTGTLLREPLDRFLLLAIPFARCTEWWIENKDQFGSDSAGDGDEGPDDGPSLGNGVSSK